MPLADVAEPLAAAIALTDRTLAGKIRAHLPCLHVGLKAILSRRTSLQRLRSSRGMMR
ncbi:hypothetical protein OHD62_31555 [Mesorhizobium sp. YC-39]|uniref:hypothetical protein n=1 Tax=unclassified Mesorhizobium TaxID=325217 RepID=UPI0021E8B449|nr:MULTISPECIES: hypothetical protein [unclassified Mesorhizobium]MCV3211203.1 hypothetical protein [Mesorhizobium sp. YC-2]MCV3232928.1 hypothetical protein [Mesorhizobium sp. YC-39]